MKARIAAKASLDFLRHIDAYVEHLEATSFIAAEWRTGQCIVPDWFFEETWRKYRGLPITQRVAEVVSTAEYKIGHYYNYELRTEERRALREAVRGMVRHSTLRAAYKGLFEWIGGPDLCKSAGGKLEYADVFPLIYLKMRLEAVDNPRKEVKHLLIDEMQDYTAVQYAVLGKVFNCRKTILGDATQSVNPYSVSNAEQIQRVLRASAPVKLTKATVQAGRSCSLPWVSRPTTSWLRWNGMASRRKSSSASGRLMSPHGSAPKSRTFRPLPTGAWRSSPKRRSRPQRCTGHWSRQA